MRFFFLFLSFVSILTATTADPWDGEDYSNNSSSQKEAAADLLKLVPLKGNEHILDVGCGDGKITAAIASRLPAGTILGIDISPSMIHFAKNAFPELDHPNLQFLIKDGQHLEYKEAFDIIFSFTALMWLPDHNGFLQDAYTSLKPSGILAITMPLAPPKELEQAIDEITALPEWEPYFQNFHSGWNFVQEEDYATLLLAHHFSMNHYAIVLQNDIFPSRENFESFFGQFFPYLRPLPQELKKSFLSQIVDRFIELSSFPDGEVHWRIRRLEVVVQRN